MMVRQRPCSMCERLVSERVISTSATPGGVPIYMCPKCDNA